MANKELDDNPSENDIYFDSSKEIIGNSGRLEGIDEIVIDKNTSGNRAIWNRWNVIDQKFGTGLNLSYKIMGSMTAYEW